MSERPILSLKRKLPVAEPALVVSKEEKPPFNQAAFEKKARAEKLKRNLAALNVVRSLELPMPLAKGVGRQIVEELRGRGIGRKTAGWAMQRWVTSNVYLNAVISGTCRFNLDGSEAELITDAEKEYSQAILEKRNKVKPPVQ